MNNTFFKILRIIFGILLVIFGAEKFIHFMPQPDIVMSDAVLNYMSALTSTKTLELAGFIELIAGLALIFNKYAALLMLILMSVSVNAVLFHATLSPADIAGSIILLILNVMMLYGYKNQYKDLLH